MIQHHTSQDLLLEYAAGGLDEANSILVASHLALCPACRTTAAEAENLGGALLESGEPEAMSISSLAKVLDRIGTQGDKSSVPKADAGTNAALPQPLRGYVNDQLARGGWRWIAQGLRQMALSTSKAATARIFRLSPGTRVPVHSHQGQELTLVLTGSYRDECGVFARGDVADLDDSVTHQPVVSRDGECLALAVTRAPLRFRNAAIRLIQPLLGI